MAEAFECPHCGAPLDYAGTGETMRCPFCGNSVIVPPELRPAPPRLPVAPPPPVAPAPPRYFPPPAAYAPPPVVAPMPLPRRKGGNCASLLVFIIVAAVVLPTFVSMPSFWRTFGRVGEFQNIVPTVVQALVTQGLPEGVAATAQAAVARAKATAQAAMTEGAVAARPTPNAPATRQALQAALAVPRGWPVTLSDSFDENANNWTTGDANNQYYSGTRQIGSGKYQWSLTAKSSMYTYTFPDLPALADLFAGVDVLMTTMPSGGQAGLTFRHSTAGQSGYVFALKTNSTYALTMFKGQQWTELIPWRSSSLIRAGRTNRLEVSAQGAQIVLLINKQVVDHIEDDRLTEGDVGVGMDLAHAKDRAEVDFDNFEVHAPVQ